MTTPTVKPSGAGGDFTTLSGWAATLSGTLSAPAPVDVYNFGSGGLIETGGVAIPAITTSATNKVIISVPVGERHNGVAHSGAYLTNNGSGGGSITTFRVNSNVDHIDVNWFEVESLDTAGGSAFHWNLACNVSNRFYMEHCIIHAKNNAVLPLSAFASNGIYIYRNTLIYSEGTARPIDIRGVTSAEFSNNNIYSQGADFGLLADGATVAKNNYVGGSTNKDIWNTFGITGDHNATSDTTGTTIGTGGINSIAGSSAFTSLTAHSEDFRTKTGFTSLSNVGTTVSAVTDDIVGTARPQGASYDIGAFENPSGNNLTASAVFSGAGSLAAIAVRRMFSAKALSGAGSLAAAGSRQLRPSVTLAGVGSLAASAQRQKYCAAALSGTGSLGCAAVKQIFAAATVSGIGSLSATASLNSAGDAAASLSGSSSMVATATKVISVSANLSATSAFSATAKRYVVGIAVLTGNGQMSAAASGFKKAAAALSGTSDMDADGSLGSEEELEIDPAGFVWSERSRQSFLAG